MSNVTEKIIRAAKAFGILVPLWMSIVQGQDVGFSPVPLGESIFSTTLLTNGGAAGASPRALSLTSTNIYMNVISTSSPVDADMDIFTAPPGTSFTAQSVVPGKLNSDPIQDFVLEQSSGSAVVKKVTINPVNFSVVDIFDYAGPAVFGSGDYTDVLVSVFFPGGSSASRSVSAVQTVGAVFYVLTTSGLYVSRDTAKSWQLDTAGLASTHVWSVARDTSKYLYAATDNGLFIQNPDSNVWQKVSGFTLKNSLLKVYVDRKNRIVVVGNGGGVYVRSNGGTTWSTDTAGIGLQNVSVVTDDFFGNLYAVTNDVFSSQPNFHIYRSPGGIGPWQLTDAGILSTTVASPGISSLSGDSILVAGTSFGMFVSTDQGTTWSMRNNGIKTENFLGFLESSATRKWFVSTDLGIYSRRQSDTSWTKSYPPSGFQGNIGMAADGIGNVYASVGTTTRGGPIYLKSTDDGATWNADSAGLSQLRTGVSMFDESGGQHLGTSQYGSSFPTLVFTKPINGSWVIDTLNFHSSTYSFTSSMASDRHGNVYISGYYFNGSTQVNAKVMRRPIGGGAWVEDTVGLGGVNYLNNLGPDRSGNIMGIAGGSLYREIAGSWSKVNLPAAAVSNFWSLNSFSVDSSGAIFANFSNFSGGRGVYFTIDGGTSWTYAGLNNKTVNRIISFGDTTYASTRTGLYLLRRQAAAGVASRSGNVPGSFALAQNYPNPFNPTTTIEFTLPTNGKASLKIYDVLGREVATLVNGEMSGGILYRATFDGSRLASGIYFSRLEFGNKQLIKKLLLVK